MGGSNKNKEGDDAKGQKVFKDNRLMEEPDEMNAREEAALKKLESGKSEVPEVDAQMIGLTGVPVTSADVPSISAEGASTNEGASTTANVGLGKSVEEQVQIPKDVIDVGESMGARAEGQERRKSVSEQVATATANGPRNKEGEIPIGRKLG